MAIHESHLILVLEVADGTQSTNDEPGIHLPREVDEQSLELAHLDALVVAHRGLDELHALIRREQRLLVDVGRDGNDESVDELEAPLNQVVMTLRDGIEAARVDGDARHGEDEVRVEALGGDVTL